MKICHPGIYEAFERVCTRNLWPGKGRVWFDYFDGTTSGNGNGGGEAKAVFSIINELGQNGVHRARFLDELIELLPEGVAVFDKRLRSVRQVDGDGEVLLEFEDGSCAAADVVVGCDGIKSRVRQAVVGKDHPSALPSYTYKYAYRGLVPMEAAVEAMGEEKAQNACMYMGQDAHVLTIPVNHGKTLNIVAFKTAADDWADKSKLTKSGTQYELMTDFAGFGESVKMLLRLTGRTLDIWAIFDLGVHPAPSFYRRQICIAGNAAHAASPHHGAGAGFCIEDSATLAELLRDDKVTSRADLDTLLKIYDAHRRPRGQWLVQSSRIIGDCYEWRGKGIGKDFSAIEAEINKRNGMIANVDLKEMILKARNDLHNQISIAR